MHPPAVRLRSNDPAVGARWRGPGSPAVATLTCDAASRRATLARDGREERTWTDPLAALAWMAGEGLAGRPAGSRWVGYLAYDLGRLFEAIPATAVDDLDLPLFAFSLHPPAGDAASDAPDRLPPRRIVAAPAPAGGRLSSTFTREAYERAVRRALDYIAAGDIFQVNLSQRFAIPTDLSAADLHARLAEGRGGSGAAYGALLDYGRFAVISNSPELFLRVTPRPDGSRHIVTRPIKGTRPRAPGLDLELLHSPKDQAELNMIVDLERNDLGRVCEVGSVRVTEPRLIEAHPTVFHGVATVEGTLRPDVSFVDLLRATFPGGSITGAPKIRAMQIIDELEPVRRGPYCGAIGYVAADGSIELNIAIRTMILKDGLAHVPVGGGIVADSTPAAEYAETLVKARAMFDALGVSP